MRLRAEVRQASGATHHYLASIEGTEVRRDVELPVPAWVEIVAEDGAYFLLYFAAGVCQTDTWHETLGQAKAQARHEFGIEEHEWREVVGS